MQMHGAAHSIACFHYIFRCKIWQFRENDFQLTCMPNKGKLVDNKEYKVITSNTPMFGNSEKMKKILDEEAQAGWDLEEKLDNFRIRVSRNKNARDNDNNCTIDPYRTNVGVNNVLYLGGAAVVTLIVIYLIITAAAMSV